MDRIIILAPTVIEVSNISGSRSRGAVIFSGTLLDERITLRGRLYKGRSCPSLHRWN